VSSRRAEALITAERFEAITARYPSLRIVVAGDFCLDRYLEIDPARAEVSIETGRVVHNVTRVRSQPGGAGTILNNLVALGVGKVHAVGFCGDDGEGYELRRALSRLPGVELGSFLTSDRLRTFTYCKPLLMRPGAPPEELDRLDSKNWSPTPAEVEERVVAALRALRNDVDAVIALEQVDAAETGVITARAREALREWAQARPAMPILADSRRGLGEWPALGFKMNAAELATMTLQSGPLDLESVRGRARELATRNGRPVFVTLAERGMIGAWPDGQVEHAPALPVRGPIDIVGAGDSVTANLTAAIAAGAEPREALALAMAAAHVVIHQLGCTGSATVGQLREALGLC
jgi:rfaE bifunctional protein kinase chain/domain